MPEKYIRLVQDVYHQWETVVRCAAGTSEPFAVEFGVHPGPVFSPFLFAIMMYSLMTETSEKTHLGSIWWCSRMMWYNAQGRTYVLELELEKWREALEKRWMKVSRANTEYMPLGSVKMHSVQLQQVTEFKYTGRTLQRDRYNNAEMNKRTECGWNNWRKMSGVIGDKRMSPHVNGKIHKMIVDPGKCCKWGQCRWLGPTCHVKKNWKWQKWRCARKWDWCGVETWRSETKSRRRRKKTLEMLPPGRRRRGRSKHRWMDSVNRDIRAIGTTKGEVHDRTGWRRIVSAAATPQLCGSGLNIGVLLLKHLAT